MARIGSARPARMLLDLFGLRRGPRQRTSSDVRACSRSSIRRHSPTTVSPTCCQDASPRRCRPAAAAAPARRDRPGPFAGRAGRGPPSAARRVGVRACGCRRSSRATPPATARRRPAARPAAAATRRRRPAIRRAMPRSGRPRASAPRRPTGCRSSSRSWDPLQPRSLPVQRRRCATLGRSQWLVSVSAGEPALRLRSSGTLAASRTRREGRAPALPHDGVSRVQGAGLPEVGFGGLAVARASPAYIPLKGRIGHSTCPTKVLAGVQLGMIGSRPCGSRRPPTCGGPPPSWGTASPPAASNSTAISGRFARSAARPPRGGFAGCPAWWQPPGGSCSNAACGEPAANAACPLRSNSPAGSFSAMPANRQTWQRPAESARGRRPQDRQEPVYPAADRAAGRHRPLDHAERCRAVVADLLSRGFLRGLVGGLEASLCGSILAARSK